MPPPSRISNNATVSILCLAASLWLRCNTDPSRNTLVSPVEHTTTTFGPLGAAKEGMQPEAAANSPLKTSSTAGNGPGAASTSAAQQASSESPAADQAAAAVAQLSVNATASARSTAPHSPVSVLQSVDSEQTGTDDHESLLVMTVSDDGHVWQWDVPLHSFLPPPKSSVTGQLQTAPAKSPSTGHLQTAPAKPALLGLLHTLPHSVTTFSVCPVPVGAGWAGDLNQPSGQSGEGGDAVAVLAAVTSAGNVELITLQRGSLTPLSSAISVSLGELNSTSVSH